MKACGRWWALSLTVVLAASCKKPLPASFPRAYLDEAVRIAEDGVRLCPSLLAEWQRCIDSDDPANPATKLLPAQLFGGTDALNVLTVQCEFPESNPKGSRFCEAPPVFRREGRIFHTGQRATCKQGNKPFETWPEFDGEAEKHYKRGDLDKFTTVSVPTAGCEEKYIDILVIRPGADGSRIIVSAQFDPMKLSGQRRQTASGEVPVSGHAAAGMAEDRHVDGVARKVDAAVGASNRRSLAIVKGGVLEASVSDLVYRAPPCKLTYELRANGSPARSEARVTYGGRLSITPAGKRIRLRLEHRMLEASSSTTARSIRVPQPGPAAKEDLDTTVVFAGATVTTEDGVPLTSPAPTPAATATASEESDPTVLFPTLPTTALVTQTKLVRWTTVQGERVAVLRHEGHRVSSDEGESDTTEPILKSDCHLVERYLFASRGWPLYGEVKGTCSLSVLDRITKREILPASEQRYDVQQFLREACEGPVTKWNAPPPGVVD